MKSSDRLAEIGLKLSCGTYDCNDIPWLVNYALKLTKIDWDKMWAIYNSRDNKDFLPELIQFLVKKQLAGEEEC